jgi:hypothetical protein
MIVSASYKTDIPAFYGDWFRHRLAAGYAVVRNPWGGGTFTVRLDRESVDGFVFWTRNVGPFLATLDDLAARNRPFIVQMTVTGYPRALERAVIDPDRAVAQIRTLASRFGPRSVVWRYDPVLITDATGPAFHRETVARLAGELGGVVDEVVLSFATIYRKTRLNLDRAGIAWRDPDDDAKRALLAELAELAAIARDAGLTPTLCAQPDLLVEGLAGAACVDAARLSDVAGRSIPAKVKGNRPGCFCAESRDIGAYDTCPHGCLYCYAVSRPETARRAQKRHDPSAETLTARSDHDQMKSSDRVNPV